MSQNLIFETFNDVKTMNATRDEQGFMHLEGVFGVCGIKNNNQRIYQKENYRKMVESLKERIATEGCPGELEHPSTMNITLENVSHKIDDIDIDENGVVSGKITLLNTPKGKIAQQIVEGGLPLFISSRAQGNVDARTGIVTLENLKTFDLVGSPGFKEARLHIHLNEGQVLESLTDNCYMISEETNEENTENQNMNEEEIKTLKESVDNLKLQVETLTAENERIKNSLNEKVEDLKQWALTDLSNGIEKWINEVYQPELVNSVTETIAPAFQKWVIEEFSPEVQNWVVEHFSPEVENWVVEEFSPEVQNWVVEHFAPEIQNWIVEQYSEGIQGWVNEELKPEIQSIITESINESKKTSLDSIDKTLKLLEDNVPQKPTYSRKQTVAEANADEPLFVQKMPDEKRPAWTLLNEDVKEMVRRRAALRDLTTDEQIQNFWESIDFDQIKPAKAINEDLANIADEYERQLRLGIRRFRH